MEPAAHTVPHFSGPRGKFDVNITHPPLYMHAQLLYTRSSRDVYKLESIILCTLLVNSETNKSEVHINANVETLYTLDSKTLKMSKIKMKAPRVLMPRWKLATM